MRLSGVSCTLVLTICRPIVQGTWAVDSAMCSDRAIEVRRLLLVPLPSFQLWPAYQTIEVGLGSASWGW